MNTHTHTRVAATSTTLAGRSLRGGLVVAAALGGLLVAPPAMAEERSCRGTLGAVTVDNLLVPQGSTCRLQGTVVKGTVKVENGARLTATGIRVVGNIQGEGHLRVTVTSSQVGGSIQLVQGRAATLDRNRVGQDIQSFSNRGAQSFTLNRVNGNLQCKENTPAPRGSGNVVQGNKEDQCARL